MTSAVLIMNAETLTLILRGVHLSIPARLELGIWPHPPLRMRDLERHLAALIDAEGSFPVPFPGVGHLFGDGTVAEKRDNGRYSVHTWACSALDGRVIRGYREREFDSAHDAARAYLIAELCLPGDLDGWKVIE